MLVTYIRIILITLKAWQEKGLNPKGCLVCKFAFKVGSLCCVPQLMTDIPRSDSLANPHCRFTKMTEMQTRRLKLQKISPMMEQKTLSGRKRRPSLRPSLTQTPSMRRQRIEKTPSW